MRLIVLGTTNDDKGSQLETLSKELLESLGYTHIATNVANDAGELDITGDFVTPMPVAPKVEKVIGECKALKVPLSMPDWLRFLGKMFIARQGGATVNGCLIALSGVNGNVQGSFDALKLNDIQLIGSSTLIDYLQKSHGLAPQAVLNAYLSSSGLTHSSIVLAYYQRRVYWVMVYDVGRYTALTADVKYPDQPVLDTIRPLIEAELEAKEFVDLREAQAQRDLQELSQKFVLVLAMLGDGKKTATELLTEHAGAKGYYEIPDDAIHAAIATLVAEGLLVGDPDRIDFDAAAVADPEKRAAIYKKYLFRSMLVAAIGCDWWDRNIDDALLDHVLTIQIGLKLPDEDRNKAINLMRLSPGALAYALQPDGMIIHKRTIEPKVVEEDERMVEHDRARFMRELYTRLSSDFITAGLAQYFFENRRIEHMERQTSITLADRDGKVVVSDTVTSETLIGEFDKKDERGNPIYIHVSPVKDFRQVRAEHDQKLAEKKAADAKHEEKGDGVSTTTADTKVNP